MEIQLRLKGCPIVCVFASGKFSGCPALRVQFFELRALLATPDGKTKTVTFACALLRDKTLASYSSFFLAICSRSCTLPPFLLANFKFAISAAAGKTWSGLVTRGCFAHYFHSILSFGDKLRVELGSKLSSATSTSFSSYFSSTRKKRSSPDGSGSSTFRSPNSSFRPTSAPVCSSSSSTCASSPTYSTSTSKPSSSAPTAQPRDRTRDKRNTSGRRLSWAARGVCRIRVLSKLLPLLRGARSQECPRPSAALRETPVPHAPEPAPEGL